MSNTSSESEKKKEKPSSVLGSTSLVYPDGKPVKLSDVIKLVPSSVAEHNQPSFPNGDLDIGEISS